MPMKGFGRILSFKGFTLVEVLVAVGLMSIMALALISMIEGQNKSISNLKDKMAVIELEQTISRRFGVDSYCSCFFQGRSLDSAKTSFTSLPTVIPSNYLAGCAANGALINTAPGNTIPDTKLSAQSLAVLGIAEIAPGTQNYFGNLSIELRSDSGFKLSNVKIPVHFFTDSGGAFLSCSPPVSLSYAEISCVVPRNSSQFCPATDSMTPAQNSKIVSCALSETNGGGDDSPAVCRVYRDGSGMWQIGGWRGNYPNIVFRSTCIIQN